ncbi:MAG: S-adenosylmethionine synthetase N-terminal domain-containing protein, partial [Christensenellales bacterium]
MDRRYFTSESVTEGHPDKLCDQVSDAVVDEILRHDPAARVACECTASTGLLNIFGEITTSCYVDLQKVARDTVRDIGYTRGKYGFDADTCAVVVSIDGQSPDIAMGVDSALETRAQGGLDIGAGDQGLMFGFACNQTEQFMPLPIELAHALTRRMSQARKSGEVPYMRPDGKSQVTVEYVD